LQARSSQGEWLVRIDDLDPLRCKPQFSSKILLTLEQFGFEWDADIRYQSTQASAYQSALEALSQQNLSYECACSRKQLEQRQLTNTQPIYDGYCLNHPPTPNQHTSIRLRVEQCSIYFDDLIQGNVAQHLENEVGDFVIRRKDKAFAYHLAVAVDDNDQGITEIVRGADLLESTPRQIYIQQKLALHTPAYAHLPVLLDIHHAKLSKQTFAADVSEMPVNETLVLLLHYLGLAPPTDLVSYGKHDILAWSIEHWQLDKVKKQASIVYEAT
jgi:glutamyl-Q tRNA(Asp) synthetase